MIIYATKYDGLLTKSYNLSVTANRATSPKRRGFAASLADLCKKSGALKFVFRDDRFYKVFSYFIDSLIFVGFINVLSFCIAFLADSLSFSYILISAVKYCYYIKHINFAVVVQIGSFKLFAVK